MTGITRRQADILGFILNFIEANGMPPTRAEISRGFGFKSTNSAEDHLRILERKGFIDMPPGLSRNIKINKNAIFKELFA